ncbi:MAG: hypothetical protein EAZ36_06535 [Verrucomicrobia bacterium]|nr:MAG: hypothetical protein EAZ36_06535 [Verrucomicrobiota bacterium]
MKTFGPRLAALLPLVTLFLSACSSPRMTFPSAPTASASRGAAAEQAVVIEGENFRYVERAIAGVASENERPYWLTGFDNSGRERVLPANNQGVALVLQAPVGVPKLVVESQKASRDRIHLRITNRGAYPLELEIACLTRTPPIRRHAVVEVPIKAMSMLDLAIDTPAADRDNLVILVR